MNSFLFFLGFVGFCVLTGIIYLTLSLFIFFIQPPFGEVNLPIVIETMDTHIRIILGIVSFLISYKYIGPWLFSIFVDFINFIQKIFNK
jgi:hypothetical protein